MIPDQGSPGQIAGQAPKGGDSSPAGCAKWLGCLRRSRVSTHCPAPFLGSVVDVLRVRLLSHRAWALHRLEPASPTSRIRSTVFSDVQVPEVGLLREGLPAFREDIEEILIPGDDSELAVEAV